MKTSTAYLTMLCCYVYYVDDYGNPMAWNGFGGFAANLAGLPYVSCPLHNQDTILNVPTTPDGSLDNWNNGVIYPDDGSYDFGSGGTIGGGGDNIYGDYSGNGDVYF